MYQGRINCEAIDADLDHGSRIDNIAEYRCRSDVAVGAAGADETGVRSTAMVSMAENGTNAADV